MTVAPCLVIGVGNPSRGDDALGPALIARAEAALCDEVARGAVALVTDFQLQIEHALDLVGRARVLFVDASVRAPPPSAFTRVEARRDRAHATHAMSPEAVLAAHRDALGEAPPEAWVLAIRGERFELGEGLSEGASAHLDAALAFLVDFVRAPTGEAPRGRVLQVEGVVQGVGFRPWVHRVATRLGLRGAVWNTPRGVTIEAFGRGADLDALTRALGDALPAAARVRRVRASELPWREVEGFTILPSAGTAGAGAMVLPPDLAACAACLREVDDATARRVGYAFTSCTDCGPRLSIARAIPWDRAATTMAPFALCDRCAAEYADPGDRRFHAETLACPRCGPRAWLASPRGEAIAADDPIDAAAARLDAGEVLGVQGLGAFHLVCDATRAEAVATLRRRKRRDAQPLAVMVADLAAAEALVQLDDALRDALTSPARPIVLAPARVELPGVNGPSRRTGVMLPYTPLHHRLARSLGRPMVVTSGNVHGGPPAIDHDEAVRDLGAVVDAFLLHDRPIARRVEDSVVARDLVGVQCVRRARGYAPLPIRLPAPAREPVLAVGGHMKSASCLVVDDLAYLTPHLGDLDRFEAERAWAREVEGFERLLGVRAEVLAYDLHPDYASTRYALARPARRRVGVQHHVAHALAVVAERHIDEPVIAVAWDGTGWGDDGTAWGGEVLAVDGARWTRLSALRPLPLPGGERAIREVWRVALGALADAFGTGEARACCDRLRVFAGVDGATRDAVLRMIETGAGTPRARGVGRYFDAIGALALGLARADFDGHVAIALEEHAGDDAGAYPVSPPSRLAREGALDAAHELDLRPTVRAAVRDLVDGVSPGTVSARFHAALTDATAAVVARALAETGLRRVVLCGGAFQNRRLVRGMIERLGASRVVMSQEAPRNDGGIALGQAWAAALALAAEGA